MDVIEGCVTTWTVPTRDSDGFTSSIYLALDSGVTFQLTLTTSTLKDHLWPTHPGQRLRATDVVFDETTTMFRQEGRTTSAFLVPEKEQRHVPPPVSFFNLPMANKITGFHREEGGTLRISLENETREVVCLDAEKSKQLLDAGIGGQIQIYNVKVRDSPQRRHETVYITTKSGIRILPAALRPPAPSSPPLSPPRLLCLDEKPQRWNCMVCGYLNYSTKSRWCWKCSATRKEGPMFKDLRHYKFEKREIYVFKRLPQWMCLNCRHRDNFYFHDKCAKCRSTRVEKVTDKRKKKKKKKKKRKGMESEA
jgi:hypothetical protein